MYKSRSSSFRASAAAAVVGSLLATTALATTLNPQSLPASSGPVSVPVWANTASNYTATPTGTGVAYCVDDETCVSGSLTKEDVVNMGLISGNGGWAEIVGTTNLNPFGSNDLTFAFALGGSAANDVVSVDLPGFSTYLTDVQACDPTAAGGLPCPSSDSGANASRDSAGNITFTATAGTGLPVNTIEVDGIPIGSATDIYAVYTNAPVSALSYDPSVLVTYESGSTAYFSGLSLTAPSSSSTVPEPSTLGLLAAGLAALSLGLSRRRRARY